MVATTIAVKAITSIFFMYSSPPIYLVFAPTCAIINMGTT